MFSSLLLGVEGDRFLADNFGSLAAPTTWIPGEGIDERVKGGH